jgi:outer membrane immunogenic protein
MKRIALALLCGVAASGPISAHAADLLINAQPSMGADYSLGTGGWDGFYAGVFAGYGFGGADQTGDIANTADLSGWLGGLVGGVNFTAGQGVVLGAAADLALADVSVEDDGGYGYSLEWVGSLRGRVGMDSGAFLPYVTAGLAAGSVSVDKNAGPDTDSHMHMGWTVGAGVEVSLMQNLSLDVQYRYTDLGAQDYVLGGETDTVKLTSSAITAGLNYKF